VDKHGESLHGYEEDTNRRLIAGFVRARVPVTGFVITKAVKDDGDEGWRSLDLWLRAGLDLGSHSDSHPNFDALTVEQMEADVARADDVLRPLLKAHGKKLEFFRFPYNDTGETKEKHDAMAAYLKERGYEVATCTIDASDYVFADAYARAMGAKDAALASRIRKEYLAYTGRQIDFYAALNKRVVGYEPAEVMLMHDTMLNADSVDDVLRLFQERGYRFVSLREAQKDPAYARPDTYVGKNGPAWGFRWAEEQGMKLGMKKEKPAEWVVRYGEGK
jgi:peptidoglycan/xylan/chitin deacetylase (PgdA/CDA1 family)